jgi:hypothetical protein
MSQTADYILFSNKRKQTNTNLINNRFHMHFRRNRKVYVEKIALIGSEMDYKISQMKIVLLFSS